MPINYYNVEDEDVFHKFGFAVVGTSWQAVSYAASGGTLWAPATATTVRVKAGGSADDDDGGSGAVAAQFYGVDETGALANERVVTAGASASASTTTTFLRVFRILTESDTYATAAGSGNNVGAMTFETTAGTTIATIPALYGQSQISHYFVPSGSCLHAQRLSITFQRATGGAKDVEVRLMQRANSLSGGTLTATQGARVIRYWKVEDSIGTIVEEGPDEDYRFNELNEWWIEAKVSSGTATVTTTVEGHLTTMGKRKRVQL